MITATLKYDYAPQANKLALITNVVVYVSTSSSKSCLRKNVLVLKSQGVSVFYWLNIYFQTRAPLATLATNYYRATKITVST